jgi:hypothetical protein
MTLQGPPPPAIPLSPRQMVIPPPGSVQPPPSTIQEQPIPMPVSYPGYPDFVPDSRLPSGPMPQGHMGDYPVVPQGVIPLETETTSEGSPVTPLDHNTGLQESRAMV